MSFAVILVFDFRTSSVNVYPGPTLMYEFQFVALVLYGLIEMSGCVGVQHIY